MSAVHMRQKIVFHRQGEIRDRTFENQSFRASGLSLITAAIVHWNTVYLDRAVRQLRDRGDIVPDDLLAHAADPGLRQRSHAGLNKGEASNSLRRAISGKTGGFKPCMDAGVDLLRARMMPLNAATLHRE